MSFVVNVQFVDHECDHEYEKDEVDDVVVDPLNHVVASSSTAYGKIGEYIKDDMNVWRIGKSLFGILTKVEGSQTGFDI